MNGVSCILASSDRSERSECSLPWSHLAGLQTVYLQEPKTSTCKLPMSHLLRWLPRKRTLLERCFCSGIISLGSEWILKGHFSCKGQWPSSTWKQCEWLRTQPKFTWPEGKRLPWALHLCPVTHWGICWNSIQTLKPVGGIWLSQKLPCSSGDVGGGLMASWVDGPKHRRLSQCGNQFLWYVPGIPQSPSRTSMPGHKIAMSNRGEIAQCPLAYANSRNSAAPQEDTGVQVRCSMLLMDWAAGPPRNSHPLAMASRQTSTDAFPL